VEFLLQLAWHAALLYLLVGALAVVYILARQPKGLSILARPAKVLFVLLRSWLAADAFLLHDHFLLRAIFRHEVLKLVRRLIRHIPKP
jgi:hypothetical protein